MIKRKRDEEDEKVNKIADRAVRIKASRLRVLLDKGCSSLTAQLRLARGFDRQKMTRRIKDAGSDAAKLARLNAELEVLKTMEPSKTASDYLFKQMVKTKKIRESEPFVGLYGEDAESKIVSSKSTAEANVLGRLFKAKAVADVLPGIMKSIRDLLGVDKTVVSTTDAELAPKHHVLEPDDAFGGFSDLENSEKDDSIDRTSRDVDMIDEDLFADYDARVAASSDSEFGDEIDAQDHDRQDSMSITTDEDIEPEAASEASILTDSDDDSQHNTRKTALKNTKPSSATSILSNPSFLPSLMMGGYYSGSDDDETTSKTPDFDPDADFKAHQQPRKNRRGQRARQLIAEKKFGAKAKHLQKQTAKQVGSRNRTAGWDAKRGAVEASRNPKSRIEKYKNDRRAGATRMAATGGNDIPVQSRLDRVRSKKSIEAEKGMHPSWEAARKRKQETKIRINAVQGKKITFE